MVTQTDLMIVYSCWLSVHFRMTKLGNKSCPEQSDAFSSLSCSASPRRADLSFLVRTTEMLPTAGWKLDCLTWTSHLSHKHTHKNTDTHKYTHICTHCTCENLWVHSVLWQSLTPWKAVKCQKLYRVGTVFPILSLTLWQSLLSVSHCISMDCIQL